MPADSSGNWGPFLTSNDPPMHVYERLLSPNGNVWLILQDDCSVVLCQGPWQHPSQCKVLWLTGTAIAGVKSQNYRLELRSDGNLVMYETDNAGAFLKIVWQSHSDRYTAPGDHFLYVQDDTNMVVYEGRPGGPMGKALYQTMGGYGLILPEWQVTLCYGANNYVTDFRVRAASSDDARNHPITISQLRFYRNLGVHPDTRVCFDPVRIS
jgi:hypothetical protein